MEEMENDVDFDQQIAKRTSMDIVRIQERYNCDANEAVQRFGRVVGYMIASTMPQLNADRGYYMSNIFAAQYFDSFILTMCQDDDENENLSD